MSRRFRKRSQEPAQPPNSSEPSRRPRSASSCSDTTARTAPPGGERDRGQGRRHDRRGLGPRRTPRIASRPCLSGITDAMCCTHAGKNRTGMFTPAIACMTPTTDARERVASVRRSQREGAEERRHEVRRDGDEQEQRHRPQHARPRQRQAEDRADEEQGGGCARETVPDPDDAASDEHDERRRGRCDEEGQGSRPALPAHRLHAIHRNESGGHYGVADQDEVDALPVIRPCDR